MKSKFTAPSGTTLTLPGFHKRGSTWTVRFSPTALGTWTYTSTSKDPQLNGKTGKLSCVANDHPRVHGQLMVDDAHPHHFRYEDGSRFFLLGAEIDWLALIDMHDPELVKTKQIIDMYAAHGFNTILMNAYAYDTSWKKDKTEDEDWGPPQMHPWPGTHDDHDFSQLNLAFWEHYDEVIAYMFQKGMVAYIYFKVYNKMVNWPASGSANDALFFSHMVARYQAYPNIIWSFAKESYYEPDHEYMRKMMNLIAEKDAYGRLRTTHDDNGKDHDFAFYGDYGAVLDFYTDQTQHDIYNNSFEDYQRKDWPISNMEPGYQRGNDGTNTYAGPVRNKLPEDLLKRIYEVVMAGGYAAYYYTWHAWDVVRTSEEPNKLIYYKYLTDFFSRTRWYELEPNDEIIKGAENHCLAKQGAEYIIYLGRGGKTELRIDGTERPFQANWMNTYTGEEIKVDGFTEGSIQLTSPFGNTPSILWIYEED